MLSGYYFSSTGPTVLVDMRPGWAGGWGVGWGLSTNTAASLIGK